MNSNPYFNFEYPDRFNRNPNNRNEVRFRPQFRGRGHQNRYENSRHFRRHPNRGSNFRQNYRQLVNDFSHQSISSTITKPNVKPKYETIVLELADSSDKLSEEVLLQHFQQTYGSVKKIWFNSTKTKAFITFFNHMSVDMCLESGDTVQINGLSIKVHPLPVTLPQELVSTNQDYSYQLGTLCKSNNRNLSAMFPSNERSGQRCQKLSTRRQLLDLVLIEGNDEKKVLEDVLKASDMKEQMSVLFKTLLLSDAELEKRNRLKDYLQEILNSNGFECRLHFIGSTVNGLGFRDSDIDIFIETFDGKQKSFDDAMASLKTIHQILKRSLKMFVPNPIPSHRCPIVRIVFSEMPVVNVTRSEALICDLSLSNALAQRNSRLIHYFCQLEPRFQQLCLLLRFWAKINGFVGSNHMSSYAFTQLVIFFCQSEKLLPTVDRLRQLSETETIEPLLISGWDSSFREDTDIFTDNQQNNDSILELLDKFFAFYANFNFNHSIICPKTGSTKHKSEVFEEMKTQNNSEEVAEHWFKLTPILSIEDPFELTHNLCANLNYKTFDKFCEYLTHICRQFKQTFGEKCEENPNEMEVTEQKTTINDWGFSRLCREWDPTPNGYAFPEYYIGFANLDLIVSSGLSQTPKDLMQLMANRLIDLTLIWISDVYHIECLLLSKWHLICGQFSPFAEFYIKVGALDNRTTDCITRQEFRKQLSEELGEEVLKEMSFRQIEVQITERIRDKFGSELSDSSAVPIDCHFALVMNCRTTFPTLELVVIDFKPGFESSKALMNFLRRMIASAANDSRLLTCPQELIT